MPRLVAFFLLLAAASASAATFAPALPAVLEIPISPRTIPQSASGTVTFLNPSNEELTLTIISRDFGSEANGTRFDFQFASLGAAAPELRLLGDVESGFSLQLNADRSPVSLFEIDSLIDGLPGFRASFEAPSGADRRIASLPNPGLTLAGGVGQGGITQDVLLEIVGRRPGEELFIGAERFILGEGTSLDELVRIINLLTDSIFVEAAAVDDALRLSTLAVGSRAILEVDVVIEAGGDNDPRTFTDALGTNRGFAFGVDAVIPEPTAAGLLLAAAIGASLGRRSFAL